MKIVFMGTPEFAVPSLDILIQNGYEVAGVITAPDKPAGRGQKLNQSAVKIYAAEHGLKIMQPARLSDESFISELKSLQAGLQIVVAFRMLPEKVWTMPQLGTFNLHGSLLPQYRGAAPINRAVMNGEKETGVTTFFLKHEIDTGNIILQEKISIGENETAGELHDRMMHVGAKLVLETVRMIDAGTVKAVPQEFSSTLKTASKIFRDDCRLDFSRTVNELHNQVRGLSPHPGAFFELVLPDETTIPVKVLRSLPEPAGVVLSHEIVTDNRTMIKASASDGFLNLLELQLPGKKRLTARELLAGFRFNPDAKIR